MTSEQSALTVAQTTRTVIDRFNETFNQHDADALAHLLTDDTVFEDTSPAPDGRGSRARPRWWILARVVCAQLRRHVRGRGRHRQR